MHDASEEDSSHATKTKINQKDSRNSTYVNEELLNKTF